MDFFIHWGVPDQLKDFFHWAKVACHVRDGVRGTSEASNVCCMGGLGARMKTLSGAPKALLDVNGMPMYDFVARQFASRENTLLTVNPVAKELPRSRTFGEVIDLGAQTKSQLETLQRARTALAKRKDFYLTSCDAFGIFDFSELRSFVKRHEADAVIFTFQPSLTQAKGAGHHTFVTVGEDARVKAVHIKSRSTESDRGLAGFFWFADGKSMEAVERVPADGNRELCVDHVLKQLVAEGRRVMAYPLNSYIHLGTPEEYQEFQFWMSYADILLRQKRGDGKTGGVMDLSIVIPCYNEAKNLPALMAGYRAALGNREGIEIILVDNGSKDDTSAVIAKELADSRNAAFRTVRVEVNQGYGFGILQGLKAARGRFCGWSHADQQCPPEDAFRLMDAMLATGEPEKCFGKGFRTNDRGNAAFMTRAQALLAQFILGARLEEINAQPKIFPRRFFDGFRLAPYGFELDIYAYYKAVREGYRVVNIDVHFLERVHGQSNWAYSLSSRLRFILRNTRYLFFLRMNRGRL